MSILKNKFSVWNKKVLPPSFFRIEFWSLEDVASNFCHFSRFHTTHNLWVAESICWVIANQVKRVWVEQPSLFRVQGIELENEKIDVNINSLLQNIQWNGINDSWDDHIYRMVKLWKWFWTFWIELELGLKP